MVLSKATKTTVRVLLLGALLSLAASVISPTVRAKVWSVLGLDRRSSVTCFFAKRIDLQVQGGVVLHLKQVLIEVAEAPLEKVDIWLEVKNFTPYFSWEEVAAQECEEKTRLSGPETSLFRVFCKELEPGEGVQLMLGTNTLNKGKRPVTVTVGGHYYTSDNREEKDLLRKYDEEF